jgi:hypothetical protein
MAGVRHPRSTLGFKHSVACPVTRARQFHSTKPTRLAGARIAQLLRQRPQRKTNATPRRKICLCYTAYGNGSLRTRD